MHFDLCPKHAGPGESGCPFCAMDSLEASVEELEHLQANLSNILTCTATALHGEPHPKGGLWSWHDLPERAERLIHDEQERCIHAFLNWCGQHPSPTINMAPYLIEQGIRAALQPK